VPGCRSVPFRRLHGGRGPDALPTVYAGASRRSALLGPQAAPTGGAPIARTRTAALASLVRMERPVLLAVPNVAEGRDRATIAALAGAFGGGTGSGVRLLDVHSDADHNRSVFTLAGPPLELADALLAGASTALERVEVVGRAKGGSAVAGQHPHVGAVDVVPIVYLEASARGAACAEALLVGDRIGHELEVPVFLYGELSGSGSGQRSRAELRRGGVAGLARALAAVEPDFGPRHLHPTAGATLLAARPPLVAFNLELAPPATAADARAIAARIREGGAEGLPGLRAIAVTLAGGRAQVSMNVEQPLAVPLASVVAAVGRHAPVAAAELVGLAPAAALAGFPADLPLPGFDPQRHIIENALRS
jgi:glutamate formiminotransferase / 5-formyltetrahydrofolate cyclo-ligase